MTPDPAIANFDLTRSCGALNSDFLNYHPAFYPAVLKLEYSPKPKSLSELFQKTKDRYPNCVRDGKDKKIPSLPLPTTPHF